MTAAFSQRDAYQIEAAAWKAFDCHPLAVGSDREPRSRKRDRDAVSRAIEAGMSQINSENPPRSREEMIRRTVGLLLSVLSFFFPQLRAIRIAGWLWDYLHGAA